MYYHIIQYLFAPGIFTAPVGGVYYFRFSSYSGSSKKMSSVLYKNSQQIATVQDHQSSDINDNGSNGATLVLQPGDRVYMHLWAGTWLWDDIDNHTTFSGFLLFPYTELGY